MENKVVNLFGTLVAGYECCAWRIGLEKGKPCNAFCLDSEKYRFPDLAVKLVKAESSNRRGLPVAIRRLLNVERWTCKRLSDYRQHPSNLCCASIISIL